MFSMEFAGDCRDVANFSIVTFVEGWQNERLLDGLDRAFATAVRTDSPNRTFHLQLNQTIELDGIFHRQLFDQRLDEAIDDHRARFGFAESPRLIR